MENGNNEYNYFQLQINISTNPFEQCLVLQMAMI